MKLCKTMISLYVNGTVRVAVGPKSNNRVWVHFGKLGQADIEGADANVFEKKGDRLIFVGNAQRLRETHAAHEWIANRLVPRDAEA
jgi:hypothetical protein